MNPNYLRGDVKERAKHLLTHKSPGLILILNSILGTGERIAVMLVAERMIDDYLK